MGLDDCAEFAQLKWIYIHGMLRKWWFLHLQSKTRPLFYSTRTFSKRMLMQKVLLIKATNSMISKTRFWQYIWHNQEKAPLWEDYSHSWLKKCKHYTSQPNRYSQISLKPSEFSKHGLTFEMFADFPCLKYIIVFIAGEFYLNHCHKHP